MSRAAQRNPLLDVIEQQSQQITALHRRLTDARIHMGLAGSAHHRVAPKRSSVDWQRCGCGVCELLAQAIQEAMI